MTSKERMAALKAQREEIDRQIRRLKTEGVVEYGPAKILPRQPSTRDEIWILSYAAPLATHFRKPDVQNKSLFFGSRKEVINAIPEIIRNLQGLYDAAVNEEVKKT